METFEGSKDYGMWFAGLLPVIPTTESPRVHPRAHYLSKCYSHPCIHYSHTNSSAAQLVVELTPCIRLGCTSSLPRSRFQSLDTCRAVGDTMLRAG